MFKIEVFEKRGDYFFIKIACQYFQSEVITEELLCTSKTKAMTFFSGMATDFLQGQIDEFIKMVRYIKPHYFDKKVFLICYWLMIGVQLIGNCVMTYIQNSASCIIYQVLCYVSKEQHPHFRRFDSYVCGTGKN